MSWFILPGLGLLPSDFDQLREALGPDTRVLNQWEVPVTGPTADIRDHMRSGHSEPVSLLGHSVGGLAAIEWALRYCDVSRLVLLDPTPPQASAPRCLRRDSALTRVLSPAVRALTTLPNMGSRLRATMLHSVPQSADFDPGRTGPYSTAAGLQCLALQWLDSWSQEHRVHQLLSQSRDLTLDARALHIVASGNGTQKRFLTTQARLSARLNSRLELFPGVGHLFPLNQPQRIIASLRAHGFLRD